MPVQMNVFLYLNLERTQQLIIRMYLSANKQLVFVKSMSISFLFLIRPV